MTHKWVSNLSSIGSDNGLPPGECQAIIWNNTGLLSIEPLETNISEIFMGIHTFSFKKLHLKMLLAKWQPFCFSLNMLIKRGKFDVTGAFSQTGAMLENGHSLAVI